MRSCPPGSTRWRPAAWVLPGGACGGRVAQLFDRGQAVVWMRDSPAVAWHAHDGVTDSHQLPHAELMREHRPGRSGARQPTAEMLVHRCDCRRDLDPADAAATSRARGRIHGHLEFFTVRDRQRADHSRGPPSEEGMRRHDLAIGADFAQHALSLRAVPCERLAVRAVPRGCVERRRRPIRVGVRVTPRRESDASERHFQILRAESTRGNARCQGLRSGEGVAEVGGQWSWGSRHPVMLASGRAPMACGGCARGQRHQLLR